MALARGNNDSNSGMIVTMTTHIALGWQICGYLSTSVVSVLLACLSSLMADGRRRDGRPISSRWPGLLDDTCAA